MACRDGTPRQRLAHFSPVGKAPAELEGGSEAAAAAVAAADITADTAAAAAALKQHRRQTHRRQGSLSQELVLRDCCFKWKKGEPCRRAHSAQAITLHLTAVCNIQH